MSKEYFKGIVKRSWLIGRYFLAMMLMITLLVIMTAYSVIAGSLYVISVLPIWLFFGEEGLEMVIYWFRWPDRYIADIKILQGLGVLE